MMTFSANMVGRLVVDGQLRWRGQWQLATIATAVEGNGGGVSTAAAVVTAAAEAGGLLPWRQRRRFATMEAAEGGKIQLYVLVPKLE